MSRRTLQRALMKGSSDLEGLVLLAGLALLGLLGYLGYRHIRQEWIKHQRYVTESTKSEADLVADDLAFSYSENEIAADKKWRGKTVRVLGYLDGIRKDDSGAPRLELGSGISVLLFETESNAASELVRGDRVVIRGRIDGRKGDKVHVSNALIEWPNPKDRVGSGVMPPPPHQPAPAPEVAPPTQDDEETVPDRFVEAAVNPTFECFGYRLKGKRRDRCAPSPTECRRLKAEAEAFASVTILSNCSSFLAASCQEGRQDSICFLDHSDCVLANGSACSRISITVRESLDRLAERKSLLLTATGLPCEELVRLVDINLMTDYQAMIAALMHEAAATKPELTELARLRFENKVASAFLEKARTCADKGRH